MKNIVFAVETIYNGENKGIKALYSKEEKARAYAERLNINFVKEPLFSRQLNADISYILLLLKSNSVNILLFSRQLNTEISSISLFSKSNFINELLFSRQLNTDISFM